MKIILIICFLIISGCSTTKEIEIVYIEEKRNIIQPKKPDAIILQDVEFEKEFHKINDIYFLLMSDSNLKRLLINLELIKKYMREQNDIIEYYEKETSINTNNINK